MWLYTLGGKFIEKPIIKYTCKEFVVFKNFDVDYFSVLVLKDMYERVKDCDQVGPVRLYYSVPCCELEVGVVSLKDDVDIELLCNSYNGMKEMHIYVEEGDKPLCVISPKGKILYKRVPTTSNCLMLEWYKEGSSGTNQGKDVNSEKGEGSIGRSYDGMENPSHGHKSPSTHMSPKIRFKRVARKTVRPGQKFTASRSNTGHTIDGASGPTVNADCGGDARVKRQASGSDIGDDRGEKFHQQDKGSQTGGLGEKVSESGKARKDTKPNAGGGPEVSNPATNNNKQPIKKTVKQAISKNRSTKSNQQKRGPKGKSVQSQGILDEDDNIGDEPYDESWLNKGLGGNDEGEQSIGKRRSKKSNQPTRGPKGKNVQKPCLPENDDIIGGEPYDESWLNEGLEGIDDEDPFRRYRDGAERAYEREGTDRADFTERAEGINRAGGAERDANEAEGAERVNRAERDAKEAEGAERTNQKEQVGGTSDNVPIVEEHQEAPERERPPPTEDWNEPVQNDEDLFDTLFLDDEAGQSSENLEFNPDIEFQKPSFELKQGHKFANIRACRETIIEFHVRER